MLELTAAKENTTYDRIIYWISAKNKTGVHAEFFSVSGKALKQADFSYNNAIKVQNDSVAFISAMTISDALTDAKTVLEFSNVNVEEVPQSEFDVANLQ